MPCLVFPVRKKEAETLFPVMLSRKLSYSSGSPNGETTYVSQAARAYVLRSVIYVRALRKFWGTEDYYALIKEEGKS